MTEVHDGPNERIPVLAGARRHRCLCKRSDRIGAVGQMIEHPLRRTGTDTGNKMHQPVACNTIARVLDETQQRQYILDVSGIEKLQTTKLDKWDVAAGQLEFQRTAMARGPEQYGLLLQQRARFPVFQNTFDNAAGLVSFIAGGNKLRLCARASIRPEIFSETFLRQIDHAVSGSED